MNNQTAPTLTQDEIEKLLGRTLTETEQAAIDLYIPIAMQRAADLLCAKSITEWLEVQNLDAIPVDLKLAIAQLFGAISADNAREYGIESKQVEDFRIDFKDASETATAGAIMANGLVFRKYSICGIKSGKILREDWRNYDDSLLCI